MKKLVLFVVFTLGIIVAPVIYGAELRTNQAVMSPGTSDTLDANCKESFRNSIGDVVCYKCPDGSSECYHNGVIMQDATPKDPGIRYKMFDCFIRGCYKTAVAIDRVLAIF